MQNALIIICLVVYYIVYKVCRAANVSDCQELEDKLFLEAYVYKTINIELDNLNGLINDEKTTKISQQFPPHDSYIY